MSFPSLGMVGMGLRGDDLMKVHPENTIDDFAYGDIIETVAEGINVEKGAKLLVINRDQRNPTDFPLLVEAEDGRTFWITVWNVKPTGVNVADQLPPEPTDLYPIVEDEEGVSESGEL
ncbi:hypothetical protein [Providencia phage PSTRCR_120]|uniref:Uncharacterized protein n=1 Tax=Providencia phage PSTRCR_120 TaxID=2800826 RepID=A0A7T6ZM07_9CAUD|nr:hypothetical protein [Providencia phage PSTRCR_120]